MQELPAFEMLFTGEMAQMAVAAAARGALWQQDRAAVSTAFGEEHQG